MRSNSLERFVKPNSSSRVENNVNTFFEDGLLIFADAKIRFLDVTIDCNNLAFEIRLIEAEIVKQLHTK